MSLLLEFQPYQNIVSERPEHHGLTVPGQLPSTPESAHQGIEPRFNDATVAAGMTSVTLEMTEHQYDRLHVSVVKFTVD